MALKRARLLLVSFLSLIAIVSPLYGTTQEFWITDVNTSSSFTLDLYSGSAPVSLSPAPVSSRLSVLVHLASLAPDEWESAQTRIRDLINANRQNGGIDLYAITAAGLQSWTQVRNASQVQSDLRKLTIPPQISNEDIWSQIAESLPDAAEKFQSLIVLASTRDIGNTDLKLYASAYLSHRARAKQLRMFHWSMTDAENNDLWTMIGNFTCGRELPRDFDPKSTASLATSPCTAVSYEAPSPSVGVFAYTARLRSADSKEDAAQIPLLALGGSAQPLSIARYGEMLTAFNDAQSALAATDATQLMDSLQRVLQIDPMYPPALRFSADIYKRQRSWEASLNLLTLLSEAQPLDSLVWSDIGEMNFQLARWDSSSSAYERSINLNPRQTDILERLSVVRENLNDLDGAQRYVAQVIALTPNRVELHVKRGDLLMQLRRRDDAIAEFEQSLKLNADLDSLRMRLISIYTDGAAFDDVRRHLQQRVTGVPQDVQIRRDYADLAVRAHLNEEALTYFDRALELDSNYEAAHFGKATALVALNRKDEAIRALDDGIRSSGSVRLRLLRFDLVDNPERRSESRAVIEDALAAFPADVGVLTRYARIMDVYSNSAGAAYQRLADALRSSTAPDDDIHQALQRGLQVAMRDREMQTVPALRRALEPGGHGLQPGSAAKQSDGVTTVPGGIGGLAAAANIRSDLPIENFALGYAQAVLRVTQESPKIVIQDFNDTLRLYFDTLEKLQKKMTVSPSGLETTLDPGRQGFDQAVEILKLLGWKVSRSRDRVILEVGTSPEDAKRQVFSSGFGIDLLKLKTDFENGRPFSLHIPYDTVPIALDESFWFEKVMNEKKMPHGLFAALPDHLPAVRLYVALASISGETRQQLVHSINPEKLAKRYAGLLTFYGSSLSVSGGQIALPGGNSASGAWERLVGVNPGRQDAFINALLDKDSGKLLAYLHTLFTLPIKNQRFFTRTPERLSSFYRVFPFSEKDVLDHHIVIRRNTLFFDLMREIPLDDDGNILFPGSDQIWMVAKGSSNADQLGKLLKRARKALAPDMEDEILLKMLDRNYDIDGISHNESENFLAVVRLDKHRSEPMDEATALLLTQNYPRYHALFPYLASLPPLNAEQLMRFFRATGAIEHLSDSMIETAAGDFHDIVSLLAILAESGGIKGSDALSILLPFCDGLSMARERADFARTTLEALQHIISSIPGSTANADDKLLEALSGKGSEITFRFDAATRSLNRAEWQRNRISTALTAQTATPLQVLLTVYTNARYLLEAKQDSAAAIRILEEGSPKLLEITPRPEDQLTESDKDRLIQGKARQISELLSKLKKESAKKNNAKALASLAQDYLEQLTPYIKVSLTAWIYAYHAGADDLVITEDRYFVRRHAFYLKAEKRIWRESEVRTYKGDSGLYVVGGLAQIGIAAGQWGQSKVDASRSIAPGGGFIYAARAQLAALRIVPWRNISSEGMHLAALQIRTGREIIVQATADDSLRGSINNYLMGLVGNFRRIEIGRALSNGDPIMALDLLSASDLFFLTESMKPELGRMKSPNPIIGDFLARQGDPAWEQVRYFGGFHANSYGCTHPHLLPMAPYEEFEHLILDSPMSERLSDVILNVVESADRYGIPSDAVAMLGESVLRQLASNIKMNDRDDWMSALVAMNRVDISKELSDLDSGAVK